ncbi:MAG TPA: 3-dehydroquinate synthase [Aggregatilinea sp.]|uniref:3-dehydroquinate synthase n=1 Tax=Aggregatilinea sp. TaxID=2806333 RepID=UPI002CDA9BBE|nr:3-dehydroquinate synthase [Aggregatilinea sp.]HML23950.1 3-dehydroquinate synthase [Aggregatilinea sp.]
MAAHLSIEGLEHTYPVMIAPEALIAGLPEFVAKGKFSRAIVITNETIAPLYGQALAERLPDGGLITVPDGEQYKTLDTMHTLYDGLLANGADRGSVVIALGGGVVGDMAGFAAASFMRGIALIQAPTSLLAMVDSSLGGKVGVDLPQGKNLVGAFKDPLAVFADTSTLATLPEVEFRCGLAEAVKSALIGDPELLEHIEANGPQPVEWIIERAASVKIDLVQRDRLEGGPRAFLNLGHTFGHAVEQASHYAWRHGEAVALGTVAAARLSETLDLCGPGLAERVENVFRMVGLPVRYSGLTPEQIWGAMSHDKKWHGGAATFVLLEDVGSPIVKRGVAEADVIDVLAGLREDA